MNNYINHPIKLSVVALRQRVLNLNSLYERKKIESSLGQQYVEELDKHQQTENKDPLTHSIVEKSLFEKINHQTIKIDGLNNQILFHKRDLKNVMASYKPLLTSMYRDYNTEQLYILLGNYIEHTTNELSQKILLEIDFILEMAQYETKETLVKRHQEHMKHIKEGN